MVTLNIMALTFWNCLTRFAVLLIMLVSPLAVAQAPATNALQTLLNEERTTDCDNIQKNTLQSVLCSGQITIGVRTTYKAFGQKIGDELIGFEIDYAKYIASELGVKAVFVPVTAVDRIRNLVDGKVDLVLATMAHTPAREATAHFTRPHYYASPTAVAGPKNRNIASIADLNNVSLCVPLGSYSNIELTNAQARILMFDQPQKMFDALRFGACDLVAHDRSLILVEVTGERAPLSMRERFEEKFSFNEIPWGMAVRHEDASTLGRVIGLITAQAHGTGLLQRLADDHGVRTTFLDEQREVWSNADCYLAEGVFLPTCLIQAKAMGDKPSVISLFFERLQNWFRENFDINRQLPMFTGEQGLRLFLDGIVVSVLLVFGSIVSTIFFGLMFYRFSASRWPLVRFCSHVICSISFNAPVILLLMLAYLIVSGVFLYTASVSVMAAIFAIGLNNGAAAGDSLVQAKKVLPTGCGLLDAARVCVTQIRACVVNAAKASPVAAFIGTPELLSTLTDIMSYSGERVAAFSLLALFYLIIVHLVIVLSARAAQWLGLPLGKVPHAS